MRLSLLCLGLCLATAAEGRPVKLENPAKSPAQKPKQVAKATPANKRRNPAAAPTVPSRVITISCRNEEHTLLALGSARLTQSLQDANVGRAALNLYVLGDEVIESKLLSGPYSLVPRGFVISPRWPGARGESLTINAHPAALTELPGVRESLQCQTDNQLSDSGKGGGQ